MNKLSNKTLSITMAALLLSGVAFSVSKTSSAFASAPQEFSLPDLQDIKTLKHIKKIESLKLSGNKDEQNQSVKDYLSKLNSKELLETAAEIAEIDKDNFEKSAMIVVPYIKKKWGNTPPSDAIKVVKDKKYDSKFRIFVLDGMTMLGNEKVVDSASIIEDLKLIATDTSEDKNLRRYALLKLRKSGEINHAKLQLASIVNNESEPAEIRGAALTAMRRTEDPELNTSLQIIISNADKYEGIVLRHAMVESAKNGSIKQYIHAIKKIAETTNDYEVYQSAIYALGLSGGLDEIKAITSVYGAHNNKDICNFALRKNENTVLSMLSLNQSKETIISGIKAAKLANIPSAIPLLNEIKSNSKDQEILNEIKSATDTIDINNKINGDVQKKWEEK
ncbi:hypothetical protein [Clostridium sp. DJ247]|uniref:hypothetical protein n=1 Tax=Clostridium sp. DJ247 TaxID=2726188 RepID=UPI001627AA93|nr:hypothetical protein [Clostridium sp. DJ247]MBC2581541.1 hypothetical protein [Clostridium sp. DJ247]